MTLSFSDEILCKSSVFTKRVFLIRITRVLQERGESQGSENLLNVGSCGRLHIQVSSPVHPSGQVSHRPAIGVRTLLLTGFVIVASSVGCRCSGRLLPYEQGGRKRLTLHRFYFRCRVFNGVYGYDQELSIYYGACYTALEAMQITAVYGSWQGSKVGYTIFVLIKWRFRSSPGRSSGPSAGVALDALNCDG